MRGRPGFVSATGVALALVLLAGVAAWVLLDGLGLFSPGALNAEAGQRTLGGVHSHAELGDRCGACHPAPWSGRSSADACLDCHTGVAAEIEGPRGPARRPRRQERAARLRPVPPRARRAARRPDRRRREPVRRRARRHRVLARQPPRDGAGRPLRLRRLPRGRLWELRPGRLLRLPPRDRRGLHGPAPGDLRQGLPRLPRRHRPRRRGLRPRRDRVPARGQARGRAVRGLPRGREVGGRPERARRRTATPATPATTSTTAPTAAAAASATRRRRGTTSPSTTPSSPSTTATRSASPRARPATRTGTDTYTCYGCHEHTTANVLGEHEGRALAELQDCVRCHPGGREAEGD